MLGEIHYKYLLRPSLTTSEYIKVVDGTLEPMPPVEELFTQHFVEIDALKKAAKPYAGVEKAGVHDVVLSNWNVVDIEIAFATDSNVETANSVPRLDFATLRRRNQHVEIVFFEAKHFTNRDFGGEEVLIPRSSAKSIPDSPRI